MVWWKQRSALKVADMPPPEAPPSKSDFEDQPFSMALDEKETTETPPSKSNFDDQPFSMALEEKETTGLEEKAQEVMADNLEIMKDIVMRIRHDPEFAKSIYANCPRLQALLKDHPDLRPIFEDPKLVRINFEKVYRDNGGVLPEDEEAAKNKQLSLLARIAQHPLFRVFKFLMLIKKIMGIMSPTKGFSAIRHLFSPSIDDVDVDATDVDADGGADSAANDATKEALNKAATHMEDPEVQEQMQKLLEDPDGLQDAIDKDPDLSALRDSNPLCAELMSDPETMKILTDPDNLRALGEAPDLIEADFADPGGFTEFSPDVDFGGDVDAPDLDTVPEGVDDLEANSPEISNVEIPDSDPELEMQDGPPDDIADNHDIEDIAEEKTEEVPEESDDPALLDDIEYEWDNDDNNDRDRSSSMAQQQAQRQLQRQAQQRSTNEDGADEKEGRSKGLRSMMGVGAVVLGAAVLGSLPGMDFFGDGDGFFGDGDDDGASDGPNAPTVDNTPDDAMPTSDSTVGVASGIDIEGDDDDLAADGAHVDHELTDQAGPEEEEDQDEVNVLDALEDIEGDDERGGTNRDRGSKDKRAAEGEAEGEADSGDGQRKGWGALMGVGLAITGSLAGAFAMDEITSMMSDDNAAVFENIVNVIGGDDDEPDLLGDIAETLEEEIDEAGEEAAIDNERSRNKGEPVGGGENDTEDVSRGESDEVVEQAPGRRAVVSGLFKSAGSAFAGAAAAAILGDGLADVVSKVLEREKEGKAKVDDGGKYQVEGPGEKTTNDETTVDEDTEFTAGFGDEVGSNFKTP